MWQQLSTIYATSYHWHRFDGASQEADSKSAEEYIDFTEPPPAHGKGRPMPQLLEGQIIVVQAAELMQVRKIIPDIATWMQ